MDVPGISVVIPTKGRAQLVARLWKSLHADTPFEVIFEDDSVEPDCTQIVALQSNSPATRIIHRLGNVSEKRTHGAREARFPIVLFLDSDCESKPGLIDAHASFWRGATQDDIVGALGTLSLDGPRNFLWRVIEGTELLQPFRWAAERHWVPWAPTANLSVRKDLFLSLGGFDPSLSPPLTGGEDVEFGLRAGVKGYRIATAPDAVAEHSTETWLDVRAVLGRLWMWGRGDSTLFRRFPERLCSAPPSLLGMTTITSVLGAVLGMVSHSWLVPLLGPLWLVATLVVLMLGEFLRGHDFAHGFAPLLYAVLDLSRICHSPRLGMEHAFMRFDYGEPDAAGMADQTAFYQWCQLAALVFVLLVFSVR